MKVLQLMQNVWGLHQVSRAMKRLIKYLEEHPDHLVLIEKSIYLDEGQLIKVLKCAEFGNRLRMNRLKQILESTEIHVPKEITDSKEGA